MDYAQFQKPQRYIGNEWNAVKKPHHGRIKICISYPDLYEIGMSNLGLRILYGLFNKEPDIVCERVFMPARDFADFLKTNGKRLTSLETKTPLNEFEILSFNFSCELNFTNFLHILRMGGIQLKAEERKDIIVMGGGCLNPEPIAEFVDVFFIGEFETASQLFLDVMRKHKDKKSRLRALSEIDGFYVPEFYSVTFNNNAYHFEKKYSYAKFPVKKIHVKDLDSVYYPVEWLVPYTQIIHDRVPVEIARGCPNRCTFCQARAQYFPYRQRKISTIKEIVRSVYKNTGYENFSFLALSASDYNGIEELIDEISGYLKERNIGIAFPSLKIGDILGRLHQKIAAIKKSSLTVAVEGARDSLRKTMNKHIDTRELFEAAHVIRSLKIQHIKLYFMFGFPHESSEDLTAIGEFLKELGRKSRLQLHVSINIFLPKPFSLWEGMAMEKEEGIDEKKRIILDNTPHGRGTKISIASTKKSIMEAVLSRADRNFSRVIEKAFLKGAIFDAESGSFSWNIWDETMKEERVDYRFYLETKTENFPWSFIDTCDIT